MIAARTLMNSTAQAARFELRFGRGRAIRAVRVYVRRRVGLVQKSIEFPAVMHARVGHLVVTDQLVLGIRIHVVLVAVEALTVFLGPARILVFLPVFRAVLLPFLWCLAGLHGLILFAAITLLRDRHDRGINHLAATCNVALRLQMPAKALEQLLNQPSLPQRLTEQPQRRAVGNAILNAKPQKPCERHAVAHLILDLFVGKIVERLQHQHPKHHDDIDRLAASAALLVLRRRQHHRLNLGTKTLERHHPINHLQWIALRRNRRKPLVRIEKSDLPHRATSANLVVISQTRTNWLRRLFFEVPLTYINENIPSDSDADVRSGSLTDMTTTPSDVCFTPDNRHQAVHPRRHLATRLRAHALAKDATILGSSSFWLRPYIGIIRE